VQITEDEYGRLLSSTLSEFQSGSSLPDLYFRIEDAYGNKVATDNSRYNDLVTI